MTVRRNDPMVFGDQTRICIAATVDPAVEPLLQAAGEHVPQNFARSLGLGARVRMSQTFHDQGISPLVNGSERIAFSCVSDPDAVVVQEYVERGASSTGYRARLVARQGDKVFEAEFDRPYLLHFTPRARVNFGGYWPVGPDGLPWWSLRGDLIQLEQALLSHLGII